MYLNFIKFHLYLFEIISLLMSIVAVIGLVYYSFLFRRYDSLKDHHTNIYNVYFTANYSPGVFGDVSINLYAENKTGSKNACIIVNSDFSGNFSNT